MMYTVYCYNDGLMDDVVVMTGTLAACKAYVANDDFADELFIVAPDGITIVG